MEERNKKKRPRKKQGSKGTNQKREKGWRRKDERKERESQGTGKRDSNRKEHSVTLVEARYVKKA